MTLPVDTTTVPNGDHTIRVVVTDASGNRRQTTYPVTVLNATPTPTHAEPTVTPTPTPTPTPTRADADA